MKTHTSSKQTSTQSHSAPIVGKGDDDKDRPYEPYINHEAHVIDGLGKVLNDDLLLGKSYGHGDCFYDSLSQSLNQYEGRELHSIDSLRKICHDFLKAKRPVWVTEAVDALGRNFDDYVDGMQYSVVEMKTIDPTRNAIPGSPDIEGLVICEVLATRLLDPLRLTITTHCVGTDKLQQRPILEKTVVTQYSGCNYKSDTPQFNVNIVIYKEHFMPVLNRDKFIRLDTEPKSLQIETNEQNPIPEQAKRQDEKGRLSIRNEEGIFKAVTQSTDFKQPNNTNLLLGNAFHEGDSFFDSLAQAINQMHIDKDQSLIPHRRNVEDVDDNPSVKHSASMNHIFDARYLRDMCDSYYHAQYAEVEEENKQAVFEWIQDASPRIDLKQRSEFIRYTMQDIDLQGIQRLRALEGNIRIEGKIICDALQSTHKIDLYITVWTCRSSAEDITLDGSETVGPLLPNAAYPNFEVHLVELIDPSQRNDFHCVPILRADRYCEKTPPKTEQTLLEEKQWVRKTIQDLLHRAILTDDEDMLMAFLSVGNLIETTGRGIAFLEEEKYKTLFKNLFNQACYQSLKQLSNTSNHTLNQIRRRKGYQTYFNELLDEQYKKYIRDAIHSEVENQERLPNATLEHHGVFSKYVSRSMQESQAHCRQMLIDVADHLKSTLPPPEIGNEEHWLDRLRAFESQMMTTQDLYAVQQEQIATSANIPNDILRYRRTALQFIKDPAVRTYKRMIRMYPYEHPVEYRDEDGRTLPSFAISQNKYKIAGFLYERGCPLLQCDSDGSIPLIKAVTTNQMLAASAHRIMASQTHGRLGIDMQIRLKNMFSNRYFGSGENARSHNSYNQSSKFLDSVNRIIALIEPKINKTMKSESFTARIRVAAAKDMAKANRNDELCDLQRQNRNFNQLLNLYNDNPYAFKESISIKEHDIRYEVIALQSQDKTLPPEDLAVYQALNDLIDTLKHSTNKDDIKRSLKKLTLEEERLQVIIDHEAKVVSPEWRKLYPIIDLNDAVKAIKDACVAALTRESHDDNVANAIFIHASYPGLKFPKVKKEYREALKKLVGLAHYYKSEGSQQFGRHRNDEDALSSTAMYLDAISQEELYRRRTMGRAKSENQRKIDDQRIKYEAEIRKLERKIEEVKNNPLLLNPRGGLHRTNSDTQLKRIPRIFFAVEPSQAPEPDPVPIDNDPHTPVNS